MSNTNYNGYKMIVVDGEYEALSEQFQAFQSNLSQTLEQYDAAIGRILTGAIPSGAVHDALVMYQEYVTRMRIAAEHIGDKFARITSDMLETVEETDSYLYSAGQGFPRDYSQERYDFLLTCLDHPLCDITDNIGDWLYGKYLWFVDLFHKDDLKKELAQSYRLVLDYNDETKAGLTRMFDSIDCVDRRYGRSIAGAAPGDSDFYTCCFDCAALSLYGLRDMMEEMAAIIKPENGSFTAEGIRRRMEPIYSRMLGYFERLMGIPERHVPATVEEIADFADDQTSRYFFTDFHSPQSRFVTAVGGTDAALMTIFGMFDITRSKIIYGDYEVYTLKKQLLDILKELGETRELYAGGAGEEAIEDCKTLLKYFKKYGKDFYEFLNTHRTKDGKLILDGRTIEARNYRDFLDSLGNAKTILDEGEKGIEYLAKLMADYDKSLEILDSFEKNCEGDEKMTQAVAEVRALFEKQFTAYIDETVDLAKEIGFDLAMKAAGETPVIAVVNAIGDTIEITGEVTGLGIKAKRTMDALTYTGLVSASEEAYKNALEAFQSADPADENYNQLAEDLRNCFDFNKKNYEEMFTAMADASSGNDRAYYNYCAEQARNADMTAGAPAIMSYEEFVERYDR